MLSDILSELVIENEVRQKRKYSHGKYLALYPKHVRHRGRQHVDHFRTSKNALDKLLSDSGTCMKLMHPSKLK